MCKVYIDQVETDSTSTNSSETRFVSLPPTQLQNVFELKAEIQR